MTKRREVLVIEDEEEHYVPLVDILQSDYEVRLATTGLGGLAVASEKQPDVIILDVLLPDISGTDVLKKLRGDPRTREIPVLMLTVLSEEANVVEGLDAGADDYLKKPYKYKELQARLKALLRRAQKPPFTESNEVCKLSLTLENKSEIVIAVKGRFTSVVRTSHSINLDVERYVIRGNGIHYPQWQSPVEDIGKELFKELFESHMEVQGAYREAMGILEWRHANLHIKVASTADVIGVPIECLYDPHKRRFLALLHPLSRLVINVSTNTKTLSPEFFNNLATRNEKLKILLIASNTSPFQMGPVPGADLEIHSLSKLLSAFFDELGMQVQIEVLPTELASYENVRSLLKNCSFNIVHYAGHCQKDPKSSDSSLFFWEHEQRHGDVIPVGVRQIENWLSNSTINLMYLSCCSSAQHHPAQPVSSDSFPSMANAIISAGVPSVLGFRWPVSDQGAFKLAETFYRSLALHGVVDTALLEARQESQIERPDENTWLAPILISQS